MNILFYYQHFWPDSPPYANMLRAIGAHIHQQGHCVFMLTGEPSYKTSDRDGRVPDAEIVDGIKVRRLALLPGSRTINLLRMLSKAVWPVRAFFVVLWAALRGQRHDVIVAATIPPVINGLSGWLAARLTGAQFVYHLQDIYPEIGSAGGLWRQNSVRHRVLLALDSFTCRHADRCVVLSQDMADSLVQRGVEKANLQIVNNFMLVEFGSSPIQSPEDDATLATQTLPDAEGRYRIIFAGNLGRFQGLELLLQAFLDLTSLHESLELHFLGEGAAMQSLLTQAASHPRVFFHGHKPFEQAIAVMASCDTGIVSIQPDIYRFAYPSKTLSYLGQGLPVLALVEQESALAREVMDLQLGVSASNTDIVALKKGFTDLVGFLQSEANDRKRIRQVTDSLYSHPVAMNHWAQLINELQTSQASAETLS